MAIQKAAVYYNNQLAGYLTRKSQTYIFTYDDEYIREPGNPPISISFPKRSFLFSSKHLFSFFYGLLAEGEQKEIQCLNLKIKEKDYFTTTYPDCRAKYYWGNYCKRGKG